HATIASLRPLRRKPGSSAMADQVADRVESAPLRLGVSSAAGGMTRLTDRMIGVALEVSTAALVVAEIVILFVAILPCSGFHRPLVWSDEGASILFLWLAVLGSALAFRRGENLRMTTFVIKLPAAAQRQFAAVALMASLAFLVLILPPAIEHVEIEAMVMTPTLEWSMTWRTIAMPIGIALMIVLGLLRLADL